MNVFTQVTVLGVGIACEDLFFRAPRAAWGSNTRIEQLYRQGGGKAATAVVAAARLGARCRLVTRLADDEAGERIASELRAYGIDLDGTMVTRGGRSPQSLVHVDVDSGERTIFHYAANVKPDQPDWEAALADVSVIIVDDYYPDLAERALMECRRRRLPSVVDITPRAHNLNLVALADHLIAPAHYLREHEIEDWVDGLHRIRELGVSVAVITRGAAGCVYMDDRETGVQPALSVEVVDTTGAGDAFHGAYASALAVGWPLKERLRLASVVAGLNCTAQGGRGGLPDADTAWRSMQRLPKG